MKPHGGKYHAELISLRKAIGSCVSYTYSAGESFFDFGEVHIADSDDGAVAYAKSIGGRERDPEPEIRVHRRRYNQFIEYGCSSEVG